MNWNLKKREETWDIEERGKNQWESQMKLVPWRILHKLYGDTHKYASVNITYKKQAVLSFHTRSCLLYIVPFVLKYLFVNLWKFKLKLDRRQLVWATQIKPNWSELTAQDYLFEDGQNYKRQKNWFFFSMNVVRMQCGFSFGFIMLGNFPEKPLNWFNSVTSHMALSYQLWNKYIFIFLAH